MSMITSAVVAGSISKGYGMAGTATVAAVAASGWAGIECLSGVVAVRREGGCMQRGPQRAVMHRTYAGAGGRRIGRLAHSPPRDLARLSMPRKPRLGVTLRRWCTGLYAICPA